MNPLDSASSLRILCLALVTSGPDARRCSILDFGAVWLHGGPLDAAFARPCDAWEGAAADPEVLTSRGRAMRTGDPYADDEIEGFRAFVDWSRCDRDPVILCGLQPSHVRAFVLAAAARARIEVQVPPRICDLHTLFLSHRLEVGGEVPASGFRHAEVYMGAGFVPPVPTARAIEIASLERDLATRLIALRRPLAPGPSCKN